MMDMTIQAIEAIATERRRDAARVRHTSSSPRAAGRRNTSWLPVMAVAIAFILAACGSGNGNVASPVTEEQATAIADNALRGFNQRDYSAWARDWSEAMKTAIGEEAFYAFRDQYHAELGDYVAIREATGAPGENPGVYRWTFVVDFENDAYQMYLAFKEGSPLVEGIHFEPAG